MRSSNSSCQTYEGGIGGCPGTEAHGGYTFCGYAAAVILGHEKLIDTDRLLRWLCNRQMRLEGGFQVHAIGGYCQNGPIVNSTFCHRVERTSSLMDATRFGKAEFSRWFTLRCSKKNANLWFESSTLLVPPYFDVMFVGSEILQLDLRSDGPSRVPADKLPEQIRRAYRQTGKVSGRFETYIMHASTQPWNTFPLPACFLIALQCACHFS